MLGISFSNSVLKKRLSRVQASNTKQAEELGIDTKVNSQAVSHFAQLAQKIEKYDKSAGENFRYLYTTPDDSQQAKQPADERQATAGIEQYQYQQNLNNITFRKEKIKQMYLDQVESAKFACYQGDSESFKLLVDYAQGKILNVTSFSDIDLSEVLFEAGNAIRLLVKDSQDYPKLMTMIMSSGLLNNSKHSQLQDAPAKLMNKSAHSGNAMQSFKKMLNSGQIRLGDFAEKAVSMDPTSAVKVLTKLALGNTRKDQRLTIVGILSKVATKQAGSNAGSMASKALKKIIKSEGENGVLRAAFHGLKQSAMAGNKESLTSLKDLAVDPTISTNKAFKAINCLTEIAMSGSNAGGEATDILVDVANNKKVSPNVRMKSIDGLGKVVQSGNANSGKASEALLKMAQNPENPFGKRALDNILNIQDTDKFDQTKLATVMHTAAKSKKLDNKTRGAAYNKLENIFDKQGAGAGNAKGLIIDLARNPHDQIGRKALRKVASMNENSSTKSKETSSLINTFQSRLSKRVNPFLKLA